MDLYYYYLVLNLFLKLYKYMNYIQKFFHTDRWWGRFLLVFIFYFIFLVLFYGLSLLIVYFIDMFLGEKLAHLLFIIWIALIMPITSFFVPKLIKSFCIINNKIIYTFNTLLVLIMLLVAIYIELTISGFHMFP